MLHSPTSQSSHDGSSKLATNHPIFAHGDLKLPDLEDIDLNDQGLQGVDHGSHGLAEELLRQHGTLGAFSMSPALLAVAPDIDRSEALKEAFFLAELRE